MSDVHGGTWSEGEVGDVQRQDGEDQYYAGEGAPDTTWPRPRHGLSEESQDTHSMPEPGEPHRRNDPGASSVVRVAAIVVSAGLAWATAVTLLAWILGRLLSK